MRSFAMEDAEKEKILHDIGEANGHVIRGVAIDACYGAASNLVMALAGLCAIGLGAILVVRGAIRVGTIVAFWGYVGGLFGPVQGLSTIHQALQKALVLLDEIFRILDLQEHLGDAPVRQSSLRRNIGVV